MKRLSENEKIMYETRAWNLVSEFEESMAILWEKHLWMWRFWSQKLDRYLEKRWESEEEKGWTDFDFGEKRYQRSILKSESSFKDFGSVDGGKRVVGVI